MSESQETSPEDIKQALRITDKLLGHLPQEEIDKFSESEDFQLYKKVIHNLLPELELSSEQSEEVQKEHLDQLEQNVENRVQEHQENTSTDDEQSPEVKKIEQEPQKEKKLDLSSIKAAIEHKLKGS